MVSCLNHSLYGSVVPPAPFKVDVHIFSIQATHLCLSSIASPNIWLFVKDRSRESPLSTKGHSILHIPSKIASIYVNCLHISQFLQNLQLTDKSLNIVSIHCWWWSLKEFANNDSTYSALAMCCSNCSYNTIDLDLLAIIPFRSEKWVSKLWSW